MCNPYENQIRFRIVEFYKIPADYFGIYGIWFNKHCLYVGQAKSQPICKRLKDHWKGTHNPKLQAWIDAKGPLLTVAYHTVVDIDEIDTLERYYIRMFQPLTNAIRYEQTG